MKSGKRVIVRAMDLPMKSGATTAVGIIYAIERMDFRLTPAACSGVILDITSSKPHWVISHIKMTSIEHFLLV